MLRVRVVKAAVFVALVGVLFFVLPGRNALSVSAGGQTCSAIPAAPTSLAAAVSGTSVALSWQPVAGAIHYAVEVGSGPGKEDVAWLKAYTSTVTVTAPAGTYYVRVRSYTNCGTSNP